MNPETVTTEEGTELELVQGLSGSGQPTWRVYSVLAGSRPGQGEMSDPFPTISEARSYMNWGFR